MLAEHYLVRQPIPLNEVQIHRPETERGLFTPLPIMTLNLPLLQMMLYFACTFLIREVAIPLFCERLQLKSLWPGKMRSSVLAEGPRRENVELESSACNTKSRLIIIVVYTLSFLISCWDW